MEKIYSTKLITVRSGASVKTALDIMAEHRIRHLPVVNNAKEIVGMLSIQDLQTATKFQDKPVDLFASYPVEYVQEQQSLSSVAFLMLDKKISSVLVVNEDEAVGIITTDDLLFHLATSLEEKEKPQLTAVQKSLVTVGEICRRLSEAGI
ncbi:MAG: hypothetical protein K0R29_2226 [Pseudobdellovibrio sp.]|nr:hypothetical protein [Pseudobdellovibrio sp.]